MENIRKSNLMNKIRNQWTAHWLQKRPDLPQHRVIIDEDTVTDDTNTNEPTLKITNTKSFEETWYTDLDPAFHSRHLPKTIQFHLLRRWLHKFEHLQIRMRHQLHDNLKQDEIHTISNLGENQVVTIFARRLPNKASTSFGFSWSSESPWPSRP